MFICLISCFFIYFQYVFQDLKFMEPQVQSLIVENTGQVRWNSLVFKLMVLKANKLRQQNKIQIFCVNYEIIVIYAGIHHHLLR